VFVPIGTLPEWLQPVAAWNPVSTLTASLRELWGNPNPFPSGGLPADYPIAITIGWMIVLLAIFAPFAVRKYRSISI
jgi:ABC-type polysaccharide/polyol phosphate export permease